MDQFIELLKEINIAQVFVLFAGGWVFYNRLKNELSTKIDKLEAKVEDLDTKVEDIDRRLCRIEGSLQTHGHCLFNQSKTEQKVQ